MPETTAKAETHRFWRNKVECANCTALLELLEIMRAERNALIAELKKATAQLYDFEKRVAQLTKGVESITIPSRAEETQIECEALKAAERERDQLLGEMCFIKGKDIPATEQAARAALVLRAHDAESAKATAEARVTEISTLVTDAWSVIAFDYDTMPDPVRRDAVAAARTLLDAALTLLRR